MNYSFISVVYDVTLRNNNNVLIMCYKINEDETPVRYGTDRTVSYRYLTYVRFFLLHRTRVPLSIGIIRTYVPTATTETIFCRKIITSMLY